MSNLAHMDGTGVVGAPHGDAVPPALAAYYERLDAGDFDGAIAACDPAVLYAVPGPGIETAPRIETRGGAALRERFEARGHLASRQHRIDLCLVDGDECLVEGSIVQPDATLSGTFVASVTLGGGGRIARYLAYWCPGAREPLPTATVADAPDVDTVLARYFGELDTGDFAAAAECFSADVLYSHPPYKHTDNDGDQRVEFRGRAELTAAFQARGRQSFAHDILVCIQRGRHGMLEGAVRDLPGGGDGSFISTVSLDDDGRIARYLSFYCEPAVARR